MAKKRRKKRSTTLSAGLARKVSKRRTTRRRRRKTGLSEMFSPATATHSAKNMVGGAIGGFGYGMLKPALDTSIENKFAKGAIVLGASFAASAVLKMDAVSSGIAGAWGYDLSRQMQGLGEMDETEFADDDALNEEPEYLDENGNPMFLAEDGNFYYLEEMEEDTEEQEMGEPMYLADAGFYPEYVNTSNY